MRVIDRLMEFLEISGLSNYQFEHMTDVANGYLRKQVMGKGSIGSDILQRIYVAFPELNFIWLLFGQGEMINDGNRRSLLFSPEDMISMLHSRIDILEKCLSDKEEIIQHLKEKNNYSVDNTSSYAKNTI